MIAGLLLVAVELRQEGNPRRAELGLETAGAMEEMYRSMQNESTSHAFAKSCDAPLEMTLQDHFVLESLYFEVATTIYFRELYGEQRGVFVGDLQKYSAWVAEIVFGCDYGKDWYRENKDYLIPDIVPFLDEHLETGGHRNYLESVDALEERIRQRLEPQQ